MNALSILYKGVQTYVVGYCPDARGRPKAIVIWKNSLKAVNLREIKFKNKEKRSKPILDVVAGGKA